MRNFVLLCAVVTLLVAGRVNGFSQSDYYFPPTGGMQWESISAVELGWCADEIGPLIEFLDTRNTKAFILLYKGEKRYITEIVANELVLLTKKEVEMA